MQPRESTKGAKKRPSQETRIHPMGEGCEWGLRLAISSFLRILRFLAATPTAEFRFIGSVLPSPDHLPVSADSLQRRCAFRRILSSSGHGAVNGEAGLIPFLERLRIQRSASLPSPRLAAPNVGEGESALRSDCSCERNRSFHRPSCEPSVSSPSTTTGTSSDACPPNR
jgi:hypothetical protein